MKPQRWPRIVGAIAVLLVAVYAGGATSALASENGASLPWLPPLIAVAAVAGIFALTFPLFRPRQVAVAELPDGIQFTISPVIPFARGLDDARRALGQETPFRKFGSFARPLVATNEAGVTIWRAAGDAHPILTIPVAAVRSVSCDEQKVQVSRVGVMAKFVCITLELQVGATELSLILPACTVVGETNPAALELVDGWAGALRATLGR